jgi:hypothetical protein
MNNPRFAYARNSKILSDEEAFKHLLPIDDEHKKFAPLSDELFLAATNFTVPASAPQHVKALDRAGYFKGSEMRDDEKLRHVADKLEACAMSLRTWRRKFRVAIRNASHMDKRAS